MTQAEKDRVLEIVKAIRESLKHPKIPREVRIDLLAQAEELEGLIETPGDDVDEDDFV
jgi:hypothetical protein